MRPGVLVLGMHRSGTSVASGVVERLGFHGGPRETMFAPDEHNSDGYWEQRPLVDFHDAVLAELDGWASAPPTFPMARALAAAAGQAPLHESLGTMFTAPWFLKDPRQCLLLPVWDAAYGDGDQAVVVIRNPAGVAASLVRRNAYSTELAASLWERYNHDLLAAVQGRRCIVVRYDSLLADPASTVARMAAGLSPLLDEPIGDDAIAHAASLIRDTGTAGSEPPIEIEAHRRLWDLVAELEGTHDALDLGDRLPPLSAGGTALIERRRKRLNRVRRVLGSNHDRRAAFDQIPARIRDLLSRFRR